MKAVNYEIRCANGHKVMPQVLDKIIADLWNIPQNKNGEPIRPAKGYDRTWDEMFIECIGASEVKMPGWYDVKTAIISLAVDEIEVFYKFGTSSGEQIADATISQINFYRPYLRLIDHLEQEGYKPVKRKNIW